MRFNPALSSLIVAIGAAPITALAATNTAVEPIERMVVTGSRIQRTETSSYAPITVFDAADIEATGVTSVEALLQRMSASAGFAGNQTNAYWTDGGYGSTQVNLRGIGVNRTLVLLNGRRMVNSGTGANASVDLNTIPLSIIDRVEVLKDGASAIYGADAVAGVVNIITRDYVDGFEISARGGQTDHGDGEEVNLDLTFGTISDNSSVYVAMSYDKTEEVKMTSRAECPLAEVDGELVCSGSSHISEGRGHYLDSDGNPVGDSVLLLPDGSKPYSSDDSLNYFKYFNAVQPIERFNLFSAGEIDINHNLTFFAEAMYTRRETEMTATPQTVKNVVIPSWHESNPTDQDFLLESRRLGEAPRDFYVETDTWRIVNGLRGELGDNWSWDAAINWGRNTGSFEVTNVINNTNLANATDYDSCSADPAVPCANFWGQNSLTDEMLDYLLVDTKDSGGNEQLSFTTNITGDLFELPAGMVAIAAGFEHRQEEGWSDPDDLTVSGEANTAQQDAIDGDYRANEVYLEANVPLLVDAPLAQKLEMTAALRYSDFDTFGDDTNYKLGLQWQLNQVVTLRTTKSTAFRVPNIPELFGGISQGYMNTTDPCSDWTSLDPNSNRYANCRAAGVPSDYQQDGTTLTDRGGNPDLKPEEADTLTVGLVINVPGIDSLSFTVDYYDIEIENAINSVNGSSKLAACYDSADMSHPFCSDDQFSRDPVTGEVTYLQTQLGNAATETVSGIDFGAFFAHSLAGFDTNTTLELSYLDEYSIQTYQGAPVEHREGTIGYDGSYTKWRGNLYFTAAKNEWQGSYNVQYIGGADDQYANEGDIGDSVGSVFYHNVQLSYDINPQINLMAGIDNLFDRDAPYHQSYTDGNTNTMTYDLLGRRYYVGIKMIM
ncbi:TonB-dependent receptor [Ferrimonas lipolytica]|uniref:TonB-dependent receptor n=1 Tax=Ferrimonas lipolytica TaxID=2724191 RepID=A0A6H1UEM4_9GAMM|nr:TonB-dependent receptor [Ferrimonas lipolytica]QIZ77278.1 TonB-dependent receptor [Ferrimonas lipolytica]